MILNTLLLNRLIWCSALATLETEDIPVEILQTVYDQRPTETELKTIQEYLQSVHSKLVQKKISLNNLDFQQIPN